MEGLFNLYATEPYPCFEKRTRRILNLQPMPDEQPQHYSGPSWATMLVLLFLAILVAIGIAYWLIHPFVPQHPH